MFISHTLNSVFYEIPNYSIERFDARNSPGIGTIKCRGAAIYRINSRYISEIVYITPCASG